MRHVVWIGGGTGSGKTSAARALAQRHGLRAFHVDAFWYAHDARLDEPEPAPDEQWLDRTPAEQAAEFEATSRRRLRLVLEDLAVLPPEPPVVVEGPQVLPDALPAGARAVFLVPTPEFQRSLLSTRPMPATRDPVRTLENRIEKDRLFAARVADLAAAHGYETIVVDGSRPPAAILEDLERALAPAIASSGGDLAAARRWENEATAANLRGWLASPQGPTDPLGAYPFACECGRLGCAERVELTLAEFARLPRVVAPSHA